ncbi:MAG: hypothetical protein JXJ04_19660 [Spirochaetales bacterium]|nr:hypothetical protein [Spirochaetales bacterium]
MKKYLVYLLLLPCFLLVNCIEPEIDIAPTPTPVNESYHCSCLEILTSGESVGNGVYQIDPDGPGGNPEFDVYCDMDFNIGGWTSVFNYIPTASDPDAAAEFYAAITTNAEMTGPVMPDSTSAAIYTSNLPLSEYTEVVYGWASSASNTITRYGKYSKSIGLAGDCYIDGFCGDNSEIEDFTVYPANLIQTLYTGNNPAYPHVGLGFSGQIIVWGYDNNASAYGNWGNWYMTAGCCNAGNTEDMLNLGWRYVIYIR